MVAVPRRSEREDIALFTDVEDDDRDVVLTAQGDSGRVHNLEIVMKHPIKDTDS
jgi:hypothetical protein